MSSESEFGVMKERRQKFRIVVDDLGGFARLRFELLDVLCNEIRHENVFHHLPALFDRVQLRRVRRQLLENEPVRTDRLEIFSCRKMRRQRIPDDHHLATVIIMDHRQEENHVLGVDPAVENRETEIQFLLHIVIKPSPVCDLRENVSRNTIGLPTSHQVVPRIGESEKPLSSRKIRGMPSRFAFF